MNDLQEKKMLEYASGRTLKLGNRRRLGSLLVASIVVAVLLVIMGLGFIYESQPRSPGNWGLIYPLALMMLGMLLEGLFAVTALARLLIDALWPGPPIMEKGYVSRVCAIVVIAGGSVLVAVFLLQVAGESIF